MVNGCGLGHPKGMEVIGRQQSQEIKRTIVENSWSVDIQ